MATLGQQLRNPKIDELMAQQAMQTGSGAPPPGPASQAPQPPVIGRVEHDIAGMNEPTPAAAPQQLAAPMGGPLSKPPITSQGPLAKINPTPRTPGEVASEGEVARLSAPPPADKALLHTKANTGAPGWEQVHNPIGRTLLGIANAVGSGLFPNIAAAIPGTSIHHQVLLHNAEGSLGQQAKERESQDESNERAARATDLASKPELMESQTEAKRLASENRLLAEQGKTAERGAYHEGELSAKGKAQEIADRKAGYRRDAEGNLEPIPYEELTPQEQVNHDFKSSQLELNDATAALRKAQAEHNPEHESLAMQRLDIANRRLALSSKQFEFRSQGTIDHVAPEGTLLSERGIPVGPANRLNVAPTSAEINKGDLAKSAVDRVASMRDILKRRPELFGPGNGRISSLQMAIGNQDPEAQKFLADSKYLADHSAALFGGRGEYIQKSLSQLSENKINVPALNAALDEAEKTAKPFATAGTRRSVGSNATEHPTGGGTVRARDPQGKLHEAPAGTPLPAGWRKE